MTNDKSKFCAAFPWTLKLTWLDLSGLAKMTGGRRVRIDLVTRTTHQQYEGFRVTILNKHEGAIDSKTFWFADHLDTRKRADDRANPKGKHYFRIDRFEVKVSCGFEWYIGVPADTKPLVAAIETFVKFYS